MSFEVYVRSQRLIGKHRTGERRGTVHRPRSSLLTLMACVLLVAAALSRIALAAFAPGTLTFPTVVAEALDKQRVTLPAGLEGQTNLLLLSFSPDQRNQLDTWTAAAQALQHTSFTFRAYSIPVAEPANVVFRWWANASLRSDETDPELWHWVVPVYLAKAAFRAQLGITDEKSVVALLVDRTGRILWRATGASSPETRASLLAAASGGRAATASGPASTSRAPRAP